MAEALLWSLPHKGTHLYGTSIAYVVSCTCYHPCINATHSSINQSCLGIYLCNVLLISNLYYMSRCAVCSLVWESDPVRSAKVGMTFPRYILHWQLVNSTSTSVPGPIRPYSSHSTWSADFSLLGKKPHTRDKCWVAVFLLRDIPLCIQWVYVQEWRPSSG